MIVKICGITSINDALAAVGSGADMLGFNFYEKSPRCISRQTCQEIMQALPEGKVTTVGVFVNASAEQIISIMDDCGLDLAQLSGDEDPQILASLGTRAFKGLRPADEDSLQSDLARYPAHEGSPAWLVDAYRPGTFGGTGHTADWQLAARLAWQFPILLAGGLRPENVADAIAQVHPWGVDVASGVEISPGVKDHLKMQEFIKNAKLAG
ncbi:MAG: phosphoribosylanthranilate isomerase [Anaerolineaceae bacterium]|nr:phosphoribosylanthranilate isomerase [Anaerolineaceae bacterium]